MLSSGWLGMASLIHSSDALAIYVSGLWLVGNGLSDTLYGRLAIPLGSLWLVGNGLSDTLPERRDQVRRPALAGWEWPL